MRFLDGIRKRIWDSADKYSPRDVAESFRDVDRNLRLIYRRKIVTGTWVYGDPFFIEYDSRPSGVVLIAIRVSKDLPSVIDAGQVAFDYIAPRIKIVGIAGALVAGTSYEMTFEVIG